LGWPRLRRQIQQRSKLLAGELDPGIPRWREIGALVYRHHRQLALNRHESIENNK